jgi:hypothetical protein
MADVSPSIQSGLASSETSQRQPNRFATSSSVALSGQRSRFNPMTKPAFLLLRRTRTPCNREPLPLHQSMSITHERQRRTQCVAAVEQPANIAHCDAKRRPMRRSE